MLGGDQGKEGTTQNIMHSKHNAPSHQNEDAGVISVGLEDCCLPLQVCEALLKDFPPCSPHHVSRGSDGWPVGTELRRTQMVPEMALGEL